MAKSNQDSTGVRFISVWWGEGEDDRENGGREFILENF